ncbi:MAG: hypothetical protein AB2A00_10555, partial [Myxococcota bacterium]
MTPWKRHLAVLALSLATGSVLAANVKKEVADGRAAYLDGDLRTALYRLTEAQRAAEVDEDDLVVIHWYSGASLYGLGRPRAADDAFDALLRIRPLYAPDRMETPPDLRAAFSARARLYQQQNGVTFGLPTLRGANITVPLSGPIDAVARLVLFARPAGTPTYRSFDLTLEKQEGTAIIGDRAIWENALKKGKLEIVLEARRDNGVPLSRAGDGTHPLEVPLTPQQCEAALSALTAPPPSPAPAPPTPPAPSPRPAPAS